MKHILKTTILGACSLLILSSSVSSLHAEVINNNNTSVEPNYQPTPDELKAYQICSNFVKDPNSLILNGKTLTQQKKIYNDFVNDYKNENCGEITDDNKESDKSTTSPTITHIVKKEENGLVTIFDPYNSKQIYYGIKNLDPQQLDTSFYQQALKKIQVKTKVINNFLITDFKYTSWNNIKKVLDNLYNYEFDKNNSYKVEESNLNKIVKTLKINATSLTKVTTPNANKTKQFVLIACVSTFITILIFTLLRFIKH